MRLTVMVLLAFTVALSCPCVSLADDNTFRHPETGFTITWPDGWRFLSKGDIREVTNMQQKHDYDSGRINREVLRQNPPVMVVGKLPPAGAKDAAASVPMLNVQIGDMGPKAGRYSPLEILNMTLARVRPMSRDLEVVMPARELEIDGYAAGRMSYTTLEPRADGSEATILWNLYAIPKGTRLIMVQTTRASGPDPEADAEFQGMIESIKLEKGIDSGDRFKDSLTGISIAMPSGWVVNLEEPLMNGAYTEERLNDSGLERITSWDVMHTLVAIGKYPEPTEQLNPTVQVSIGMLTDETGYNPDWILENRLKDLARSIPGLKVLKDVSLADVDGMDAAVAGVGYGYRDAYGNAAEVRLDLCIITRGLFMFEVQMAGPASGGDESSGEFGFMLDSIRIEP